MLANVYLHYALDLWFERVFQRNCKGVAFLHRYADDFVCGFAQAEDAQRFYGELEERLRKFELELAGEKTRVIPFSRYRRGETSFDFLGFEFYWEPDRKGRPRVKRRTASKKLEAGVQRMTEWIKKNRHKPRNQLMRTLRAKLRGTWNYYG